MQTTLVPDQDNTLYEDPAGALSNGVGVFLFSGKNSFGEDRRALLHFDIAWSLPAGVLIDSAILTLKTSQVATNPVTMGLHRVLAIWGEGVSDASGNEDIGTTPETGDATWIHAQYNTAFWANAGGDFDAAPSSNHTIDSVGPHTWPSSAQLVVDVQQWLDDPASNFGWVLSVAGEDSQTVTRFSSREAGGVNNKPSLTVYYSVPSSVWDGNSVLPANATLHQNYPNPFNPATSVEYSLLDRGHVNIEVFNVLGERVRTLIDREQSAGSHTVVWDGRSSTDQRAASGVFLRSIE